MVYLLIWDVQEFLPLFAFKYAIWLKHSLKTIFESWAIWVSQLLDVILVYMSILNSPAIGLLSVNQIVNCEKALKEKLKYTYVL